MNTSNQINMYLNILSKKKNVPKYKHKHIGGNIKEKCTLSN